MKPSKKVTPEEAKANAEAFRQFWEDGGASLERLDRLGDAGLNKKEVKSAIWSGRSTESLTRTHIPYRPARHDRHFFPDRRLPFVLLDAACSPS